MNIQSSRTTSAPEGIMAKLRSGTREAHQSIERTELARSMAKGTMSLPAYVAQLSAYAVVLRTLEDELSASRSAVVAQVYSPEMSRLPFLRTDLAALSHVPARGDGRIDLAVAALCASVSAMGAAGVPVLGALYVFEGSSLGASMLLPRMQAEMGLADDQTAYYRGHGEATLVRWRELADRMNRAVGEPEHDRVLGAARRTFAGLEMVFDAIGASARAAA